MQNWIHNYLTVAYLEIKAHELNMPIKWLSFMIAPIAYLLLLGVGLSTIAQNDNYLFFALPGIVILQSSSCIGKIVVRTVAERRWALSAFKLHNGVQLSAYFLGIISPMFILSLVQTLGLLIGALVLRVPISPLQSLILLLCSLLAVVFWSCFGFALSAHLKNYATRDLVLSLLILPLTFAAPVFYEIDKVPFYLQMLCKINPLTYQIELARSLVSFSFDAWAALISALCLVFALFIALVSAKGMKEISFEA